MGVSLLLKQFVLLLWKNFTLQIRRPVGTVFEVLLPTFGILLLIALRVGNVLPPTDNCFLTFEPDNLNVPNATDGLPYSIYFTPDNSKTNDIIRRVVERLGVSTETFGFDSESVMVENLTAIESSSKRPQTCFTRGAGIVFERLDGKTIEYTLRLRQPSGSWDTAGRGDASQIGSRTSNLYLEEGFLHLQNAVSLAIIEAMANKTIDIKVSVEQFPYPPYVMDNFYTALSSNFAVLVIMAFIFSAAFFVKELVLEKESRIREVMLMMGLKQWILWTTWYLKQFLYLMISVVMVCILLKVGRIFPLTDFFLLLFLFIAFTLSMISFGFLISVWFNSARLALAMGFTLFFLNFCPFYLVQAIGFEALGFGGKMGMCVLSNACMALGIEVIVQQELRLEGLQWSNAATPLSTDDQFNIGWVFFMLLLETVVYMLLAWYVNGVKPGQYGVRLPFYFPCLPSYWIGKRSKSKDNLIAATVEDNINSSDHETVTRDLEVGISIRNLTKIFDQSFFAKRFSKKGKPQKKAVDNMSLNIYKGQITALLGHNGAGKTTTMSILTGLYSPTSGTATINGLSILTDLTEIRKNLGICPQHNVLFDRLTLSEHLAFFLRLKGVFDRKRIREEVMSMIEDIRLVEKKDVQASRLSGGMKRKLSVAIALIGGSDIVILDEPTSGMDPYARRSTWDLLAKHKAGRTMLLTTHFMDEADLLGDRIAIMAEGKLRCSGSSLFLKSKYGVGYHMTLVKDESCDPSRVERLVKSVVPNAEQVTDVGAELSYILPSSSTPSFPELFDKLEAEKAALGIQSFGISVTTMEEVFMKVGEGVEDERLKMAQGSLTAQVVINEDVSTENDITGQQESTSLPGITGNNRKERLSYTFTPNTGLRLRFQQLWAMLVKKFYISIRAYGLLIGQVLFPVFFIILGNVIAISGPSGSAQDPKRTLAFQDSALFGNNLTLFYAQFGSLSIDNSTESALYSGLMSSDFDASNVFNYTEDILQISERSNADSQNFTLNDCCSYRFQILDQFCASRSARSIRETCNREDEFGYDTCSECLSCCNASATGLMSCSNPLSLNFPSNNFCPSSPRLSYSSAQEAVPRGSLESDNVYIAEHLLRTFAGIRGRPDFYFRSFQAGFSVNRREPSNSVCGCNNLTQEAQDFMLIDINGTCNATDENVCVCGRTPNTIPFACSEANQTVGAVFPDQERPIEVTVWYNNQPLHMSAAALNVFHTVLLRSENSDNTLSIVVNNHPLPRNASEQISDAASDAASFAIGSTVGFFVVFAFSSIIASFVLFPVEEKEKKIKHLQFLSGLHSSSYWLANFAWDLFNTLVPIVLTIIIFAAFQVDAFSSPESLGTIFILLVLFLALSMLHVEKWEGQILTAWAGTPLAYMFSFLFSNSLVANAITNLLFIFAAIIPGVLVLIFRFFVTNGERTADIIHYIFLILPTYGLSAGISDLVLNQNLKAVCQRLQLPRAVCINFSDSFNFVDNPLAVERPGIGVILIYLFFEGLIYFSLTLLIQEKFYVPLLKSRFKKKGVQLDQAAIPLLTGQDSDVRAEATKVLSGGTTNDDVIIMKNLVKVYSAHLSGCAIKQSKRAVDGISLAIPSGECFGLLGVNGAGKTTTFGILTGEFSMTSGTSVIAGYDVSSHIREVQQRIGYCPQFDALLELMTGREVLTMFARLRGVPEKEIKDVVDVEITRLDLKKHADKRCEKYSGGNKRKLCTAIALVGNPPIVLLDEPTTGMDPTTKRYLWDVLTGITKEGRSIVLTSHSMEECEALCTRLAIMVNGSFKCLGSVQHLKNKFSSGLTLQAKVNLSPPPDEPTLVRTSSKQQSSRRSVRSGSHGYSSVSEDPTLEHQPSVGETAVNLSGEVGSPAKSLSNPFDATSLHMFIREAFPGSVLLEEHQGFVTYQLPSSNQSWSSTFREIERNKERLGIVDYSVSQTTLDQVFINFAKEQQDE